MGCRMQAMVETEGPEFPGILKEVTSSFEDWEQSLSRFRSDSELCQLNGGYGSPTRVSDTLWEVFQTSLAAERLSGGLVSPLVLDALLAAGYDRSFDRMFSEDPRLALEAEPVCAPLADVSVDPVARTLTLPAGHRLDFGGVAKGWAAHQAAERLKAAGPSLVNAGGDIAVTGLRPGGDLWPIGIADPFDPSVHLEVLYLGRGGVATSGKDYRRWSRNGMPQHHIIDPRTGLPAESDVLSVTVIAATVIEAEAIAKFILISGSLTGLERLNSDPDLAGLIVLENGQCLYSRALEYFL